MLYGLVEWRRADRSALRQYPLFRTYGMGWSKHLASRIIGGMAAHLNSAVVARADANLVNNPIELNFAVGNFFARAHAS